ncbi:hypothetical protein ACH5A3_21200 [Streptomyces echinatus]|uniref:hypothetical protein n=1 Tax=Streptomyces echinatus TaxID=67293 RepID=UPI0037B0C2E1
MPAQPMSEEQLDRYAELAITADHDGVKVDPTVVTALVDEVRRRQFQVRYLLQQIAKRDAASGEADRKVREFLAAEEPADDSDPGTRPCGHDDYHDPHEWAGRPDLWCPGQLVPNPPYDLPDGDWQ